MSNIAEFKSKGLKAKEKVINHLRWLADTIEKGEEFQWNPEMVIVTASSPTGLPVFHLIGNEDLTKATGMLELTKDVISATLFMEADAPPKDPSE